MTEKEDNNTLIPKQLRNVEFRFCKVETKGKKPLGMAWQKDNYKHDDYALLQHLQQGGNYGLIGGPGRLRIIDTDKEESAKYFKEKLDTLTDQTPSGNNHFYITTDYEQNHVFKNEAGEFRANNYMVVGPGCYAIDKKKGHEGSYKICNDKPIQELSKEEVEELLKPWLKSDEPNLNNNLEGPSDTSRSGIEYRHVCSLISKGRTKEEIFQEMMAFQKWANSPQQYRDLTYNNAFKFLKSEQEKKLQEIQMQATRVAQSDEGFRQLTVDVLQLKAMKKNREAEELLVEAILKKHKIKTVRNDENTEMYIYEKDKGIYSPNAKTYIREFIRNVVGEAYSSQLGNNVIAKIEADTYVNPEDFFCVVHVEKIVVKNGILNILTKELKPFDNTQIHHIRIPVTYDKSKDCPNIKQHLKNVLKNEEDINVVQELFGYLLLKNYKYPKGFLFIGNGRNGKSITLLIMKRFIGVENCSNIPLQQFEQDIFALGELCNKLANMAGDIGKQALKDTGYFKTLTGRDLISASRKFLSRIKFENFAKMIFCANEVPLTYDLTLAFFNRWVLIIFPYTFLTREEINKLPEEEKIDIKEADINVIDKLTSEDELSGLLNWALEGLERLTKQGGFSYSKTTEETKALWMRKSSSFNAFLTDCIKEDSEGKIIKTELRKAYILYCKEHKLKVASDKVIQKVLSNSCVSEERDYIDKKTIRFWEGIRFNDSCQDGQDCHDFYTHIGKSSLHIECKKGDKADQGDKQTKFSEENLPKERYKCPGCGGPTISKDLLCPNCVKKEEKVLDV